MRRALADRRLELGSVKALAVELGLSESATSRLLKRGPPSTWNDERLTRFAESLYARAHTASTARTPSERDVLAAKRKAPESTPEGRRAAVSQLERALLDLEARRACERGSWTPRAALARELGVTSVRLGRWLRAGSVPADSMERVSDWAEQRAEAELRKIAIQGRLDELIQASKKPGTQASLSGAPQKPAARAPDMATGEGATESAEQSGYEWVLRVEDWSSFELIAAMCKWALSRRRKGPLAKPAHRWIVTAFLSTYESPDSFERRPWQKGKRSPGAYRQFDTPRDREIGRSLQLGAVVSSGLVSRGGLELAVERFRDAMTSEHCDHELVFVHSVLVRNWRMRGETERQQRRARESAKFFNERALAEQAKAAEASGARAAAKKKALGRSRSRAGGAVARGKKKRT